VPKLKSGYGIKFSVNQSVAFQATVFLLPRTAIRLKFKEPSHIRSDSLNLIQNILSAPA
jgi:hypothetical protein